MVETGSTEVDQFLARLDAGSRESLERLRSDIRDAAPDAKERIGYGVPSFRYRDRPLVSYGAGKEHCSFYVQSPAVMEAHAEELADYRTSKGTVHFAPGTTLPAALVTRLVRARMAETDSTNG